MCKTGIIQGDNLIAPINRNTPAKQQVYHEAGRAGFEPANEVLAPLTA